MAPLSEQDPAVWRRPLISEADSYFSRASAFGKIGPRLFQAALHRAWCKRKDLAEPPPWRDILQIYDLLLSQRDDPVVRLNRAVPLAEVIGISAALEELESLEEQFPSNFLPYHAVRADLLRRAGRPADARDAYDAAIALDPAPAERIWLKRQRQSVLSDVAKQ
jgi:RNA polymerase sigma-70 factor (ECF subfamily)